jgi:bla regulator protein blaR1
MIGRTLMAILLSCGMALGQASPVPGASVPAKPLAFDVVSIRQNVSGGIHDDFGATPDGFHMANKPLILAIITAYVPQSSDAALFTNVLGLPEWARHENFDIDAKVSEADLPEWQKPASQKAMLRAMMQAMLADRFKLLVHRETKDESVYSLVVGKNGPKFKETNPADPHPGLRLPGGGVMVPEDGGHSVHFYEASMATLGSLLSSTAARPVVDNTGLTGKYDFVLQKPEAGAMPSASQQEAAEPAPTVFSVVEALGLKLVPSKGSVETLVIDHVEQPSEN